MHRRLILKSQSKKQKGRILQQLVRDALLKLGAEYGLQEGDIESRSMGANGVDVILSPAAKKALGNIAIECKNVEKLSIPYAFWLHAGKYPVATSILVHKTNYHDPLVTLRLSDYIVMLSKSLRCAS
jgi:hypothetical protein